MGATLNSDHALPRERVITFREQIEKVNSIEQTRMSNSSSQIITLLHQNVAQFTK